MPGNSIMSRTGVFLVKEDHKEIKFDVISETQVENPDSSREIVSDGAEIYQTKQEAEEDIEEKEKEFEVIVSCRESDDKKPRLGESEVAESDEGFKTPTSLDHKIPVITQCPGAPRKARSSTKRKSISPERTRRRLGLNFSDEIESMFPSRPVDEEDNLDHKIKKARRHDAEV